MHVVYYMHCKHMYILIVVATVNIIIVNMSNPLGTLWCLGTSCGLVTSPTKTAAVIKAASRAVTVDPIVPPVAYFGNCLSLEAFTHRAGGVVCSTHLL